MRFIKLLIVLLTTCFDGLLLGREISWPTAVSPIGPRARYSIDECIQSTESGKVKSGKFGLVRNDGTKFHEGIDIRSFEKNNSVPSDSVLAFMDGKVVYVNKNAAASSYGKYVVIDHGSILTLYAHLSESVVKLNQEVKAGQKIGVLGTTSNCVKIPNQRAHVHFEIDFKIGDDAAFAKWYCKNYKDSNLHGAYNGMNLAGIDPIKTVQFLLTGKPIEAVLKDEKFAVKTRIVSSHCPDFFKKYRAFSGTGAFSETGVVAWDIEWTWYGLPMKWVPLYTLPAGAEKIKLVAYRQSLLNQAKLRDLVEMKNGRYVTGNRILKTLEKMGLL